jgi:type I site-specific restriction-modification system R (restriction) subunit
MQADKRFFYEKTVPELNTYIQIGIAAEQTTMYSPIVPWQEEVKVNQWKEEEKDPIDSIIEMISKDTLLDIIRNFIFFRVEMGNSTKVIARYMQYRAARKNVVAFIDEGHEPVRNHGRANEKHLEKSLFLFSHRDSNIQTLALFFDIPKE